MHFSRISAVLLAAIALTSSGVARAVEFEDFWGRDYSPGQPSTAKRVTVYSLGVVAIASFGVVVWSQVDAHHQAAQIEDVKATTPASQICAYPYEPTCLRLNALRHAQGVDVNYSIAFAGAGVVVLLGDFLLARLWPNEKPSTQGFRLVPSLGGAQIMGSF